MKRTVEEARKESIKMAKYEVTYTCGHTDTIELFGRMKDREWRLEREKDKLCPECWKKQLEEDRAKENAEAAEANKTLGLPELEGTEKQIPWAESIRQQILSAIEKEVLGIISPEKKKKHPDKYKSILEGVKSIKQHTAASWWIDRRRNTNYNLLIDMINDEVTILKKAQAEPPKAVIEEAKIEATVYPEEVRTELVTEIAIVDSDRITAKHPAKDDAFRELVRGLGYRWDRDKSVWARRINEKRGPVDDRVVELANKLLAEGFPIRLYDKDLRERAIAGQYDPEHTRWVMSRIKGDYTGWLSISWGERNKNLYDAARKIKGSKYSSPDVVVPPENYLELLDFAEMYEFKISPSARKVIDDAKKIRANALTTGVKVVKKAEQPIPEGKPGKLEVPESVDIDDTLRD